MKTVSEHLASAAAASRTLISFEIVQPKTIHFFVMWTSDPVEEVLAQVLGRVSSR